MRRDADPVAEYSGPTHCYVMGGHAFLPYSVEAILYRDEYKVVEEYLIAHFNGVDKATAILCGHPGIGLIHLSPVRLSALTT